MWWLVIRGARSAPRRLFLATIAAAFPVAVLASTLLFIEHSVQDMTRHALAPVQVDMRALATTLNVDMSKVNRKLDRIAGVRSVDSYGAADVVVGTTGAPTRLSARLVAVDRAYLKHHRWVRATGDLRRGVLLNGAVATSPGFSTASSVSIELRGSDETLGLHLPVAGQVDVRRATAWFEIPAGEVQGDVAVTPRVIVVDYGTFQEKILPSLQRAFGGPAAVTNPGLSELPAGSLESHVTIARDAFPSDPAAAAAWSGSFRRVLERQAPGAILVADNTLEPLTEAAGDATSAKVIFLLLGIPGVLVAAALGLAAASALADAQRREDALLRLRGASDQQLARLAMEQGLLAGAIGTALGLGIAAGATSLVVGAATLAGIPADRLVFIAVAAVVAGSATTAARLVPLRTGARSGLATERRHVTARWTPLWRRAQLDFVALVVGFGILAVNIASGGIRLPLLDTDHQSQTLTLSFFVLLAPISIWVGLVLLAVRGWLSLLARRTAPDQARQLSSWPCAAARWLGRRPARAAVALSLGALAVAFGTMVVTFGATYADAKQADAEAAFGADLRLEPATDRPAPLPPLNADVTATSPINFVPARAGSDRKTIAAIDPASYLATASMRPQVLQGEGVGAITKDRYAVIVAEELAKDFDVRVGDTFPVTIFPDDLDLSQKLKLHVAGVFRSFPPDDPFSEMVMGVSAVPAPVPAPDMYLARTSPGSDPVAVATALRHQGVDNTFTVLTVHDLPRQRQRSIAALNLDGLSRIEAIAAGLIAAIGVGVLGAFLVLERRKEFAVLRTVGATGRQLLTSPAIEGAVAALGSVVIGIPVGVALAVIAVRVLGLFFTLPPPVVSVPVTSLVILCTGVLVSSAGALAVVLRRVSRVDASTLLREP